MRRSNVIENLRIAIERRWITKIERADLPAWLGIPLDASASLVLVRSINDLFLDGYAVLPIADIVSVRTTKTETFMRSMLEREGLLSEDCFQVPVRASDWRATFEDIRTHYKTCIAENEHDEEGFVLGDVRSASQDRVELDYIFGDGRIDSSPATLKYSDITRVSFDEHYIRMYAKYALRRTAS